MFCNSRLKIFAAVGSVFSIFYIFLISQNRLPFDHDTFQYLQQQYIYFNEIVQNGSLPLWFPFMSHGLATNVYFFHQLNLLSPVLYLIGFFANEINYLYLFYLAIWFHEMFFLAGVILLSSIYYKNRQTILWVCITLMGSSIWYPQIWWNFHLYYYIPIVLYSIHRFFATLRVRYLAFTILFFSLTVYGNLPYYGIFVSFVILTYILFTSRSYSIKGCLNKGKNVSLNFKFYYGDIKLFFTKYITLKNCMFSLFFIAILFTSLYHIKHAESQTAFIGQGRDASGRVNFFTFLSYGGSIGIEKYTDFLARYGKSRDINLYAGIFLLPFVLMSILYCRKRISFSIAGVAVVVILFSIGIFVSHLFYFFYPMSFLFRHIGLTATVAKLFIVFYAGFGFELFFEKYSGKRIAFNLTLLFLIISGVFLLGNQNNISSNYFWFATKLESNIFIIAPYVFLFIGAILFWFIYTKKIKQRYLVSLLLLITSLDLFVYKYSLLVTRMPKVPDSIIECFTPYKYDFPRERLLETYSHLNKNNRVTQFLSLFEANQVANFRTVYNTVDSFFYADSFRSSYRTDFMSKYVKRYLDMKEKFPNNQRAYEKYSAMSYPKISAFSKLNIVSSDLENGQIFNLDSFSGDMLFTTERCVNDIAYNLPSSCLKTQIPIDFKNSDQRLKSEIDINDFTFNSLSMNISVTGPANEYCYLYYADAYHKDWQAYVNGKKTPVIRANIAYKAVPIPYGSSEVVFKFGNAFYYTSFSCTILMNLFILCSTVYIFYAEVIREIDIGNQLDKNTLLN